MSLVISMNCSNASSKSGEEEIKRALASLSRGLVILHKGMPSLTLATSDIYQLPRLSFFSYVCLGCAVNKFAFDYPRPLCVLCHGIDSVLVGIGKQYLIIAVMQQLFCIYS